MRPGRNVDHALAEVDPWLEPQGPQPSSARDHLAAVQVAFPGIIQLCGFEPPGARKAENAAVGVVELTPVDGARPGDEQPQPAGLRRCSGEQGGVGHVLDVDRVADARLRAR